MRIGVLGSGAREHALQWALKSDPAAETVYALPGNGGTTDNVPVDPHDTGAVQTTCEDLRLDLLVVGPEAPLAAGIVDAFTGHRTRVFGPTQAAARLEASKSWAKAFMQRHRIPTPVARTIGSLSELTAAAAACPKGCAIKADGLAGGKGVVLCRTPSEADAAWHHLAATRPTGERILVEPLVGGWELSIHVLTDGSTWALFPSSQDHKALYDGNRGPNTGGMGTISPVAACDQELIDRIIAQIVEPTVEGLREDGIRYCGFLYFGLMITADGPVVLEYNARLGDPETQVLLPALTSDPLPTLLACLDGALAAQPPTFAEGCRVGVVLASAGYPAQPITGHPIVGLEPEPAALVFHGGTQRDGNRLLTAGGRVLTVVGDGPAPHDAIGSAYRAVNTIRFDGMQYRKDIGMRGET